MSSFIEKKQGKSMNNLVVVSKGNNPYLTTKRGLQKFPLPDLQGRKILIKPNAARTASPGEGITTHPQVLAAMIDVLREKGAGEMVLGESCIFGVKVKEAFQATGLQKIAEQKKIKLVDLDRMLPMSMAVPGGKILKKIKVSSLLKEFDFILSAPVMKTHMHTGVTLSIKNMKGLLWRREKSRFHQLCFNKEITKGQKELDIAISEMASILLPHLAIIDGTVGMEGMGPAYGKRKKAGIIVIGNNPLSTDAVAAQLMGFSPEEIPHLRLAAERGLGEINPKKITVDPVDYMKWTIPFEPPPSKLSIPFPDIIVHDEGACSACLSTLLVFLQDYSSGLTDYRLEDEHVHVAIGKNLGACPEGTILIGNCTARMKDKGVFIQGCPPVSSQVMNVLKKSLSSKR